MSADRLRLCENAAAAEAVLAVTRHEVRNKLAAIANACRYVTTRVRTTEVWTSDPRVERFLAIIEKSVIDANAILENRDELDRIFPPVRGSVVVGQCLDAALGHASEISRLSVRPEVDMDCRVEADPAEVTLLLSALVRWATEETGGQDPLDLSIAGNGAGQVAITVAAQGGVAVSGRRSLTLETARRICRNNGGSLVVDPLEGALTATVTLPASP